MSPSVATVPATLAALLLAVVIFSTFGRRLHQLFAPHDEALPFPSALLSGIGAFTFWWLWVVPMGGGHTIVAGLLFLLAALGLTGHGLLRQGSARSKLAEEHFLTLAIIHTALLWPWLSMLAASSPLTIPGFNALHAASAIATAAQWPAPAAWDSIPSFTAPLGWLVPQIAAALPLGDVPPAFSPLLNGVILVAGAGLMVQAGGVRPSWSNLPLAAASGFFMLLLLQPALNLPAITTQLPQAAAGFLLLATAIPLTGVALPLGWPAMSYALMLCWLTALHPLGLPAVLLVATIWTMRGLWHHGPTPRVLLAGTLLATLPILTAVAMLHTLAPLPGTPTCLILLGNPEQLSACIARQVGTTLPAWQAPVLVLLVAASAASLAMLERAVRWRHTIPLTITALLLGATAAFPSTRQLWPEVLLLCAPLLALNPIRAWNGWYSHSRLRQRSYRTPWTLGTTFAALLLAAIFIAKPLIHPLRQPLLEHTQTAAGEMLAMPPTALPTPLATIGLPPEATAAMGYYLRRVGPVQAQPEQSSPMATHRSLRHAGYAAVWAGPEAAQHLLDLNRPLDATLLLRTEPDALVIRAVYPLPAEALASSTQIK